MSDPDPMDVPKALEALNAALRLQYRSALQYLIVAGGSTGLHALTFGDELSAYAQAEFDDARLLVAKVAALGGEPTTEVAEIRHVARLEDALEHLIETEREALEAIAAIIPHTGQGPDSEALEHVVEHILMRKQDQLDLLLRATQDPG